MTDFQACADDHVDTSSSVTSACYICRSCLSSPKGRRTLDSVSEQNRKAVSFIERFVTDIVANFPKDNSGTVAEKN